MNILIRRYFTAKYWLIFIIVLFCIRYIPLETRAGPSLVKLAVSVICGFILFTRPFFFTRAVQGLGLYAIIVFCCIYLHPDTFRWSTYLYMISFLLVYCYFYYALTILKCIDFELFIRVLKAIIVLYFVILALQQCAILIGVGQLPIINLTYSLNKGIGANAISGEPSSSARILTVLFLALIRMYELKFGNHINLKTLYREAKYPLFCFIWCMLTMQSGTAMVGLSLLVLYFLRKRALVGILCFLIAFFLIIPQINYEPLQRILKVVIATLSMNPEAVIEADGSASSRVTPLINTIVNLNLFELKTWFGYGVDYTASFGGYVDQNRVRMIGGILEYGLLSFVIMQIFIYRCVIRYFFSLETMVWIFLFGMAFGNVAYTWGAMMILTTVRYFQEMYNKNGFNATSIENSMPTIMI